MGKFLTKTFSGYHRNWGAIPGGLKKFKLTVLYMDTGERVDLSNDALYWVRRPIWEFKEIEQEEFDERD